MIVSNLIKNKDIKRADNNVLKKELNILKIKTRKDGYHERYYTVLDNKIKLIEEELLLREKIKYYDNLDKKNKGE